MIDRYFYSDDGLWCDGTKPFDENNPDFDPEYLEGEGPWFEEIEVGEVLNDQDFIIKNLLSCMKDAHMRLEHYKNGVDPYAICAEVFDLLDNIIQRYDEVVG